MTHRRKNIFHKRGQPIRESKPIYFERALLKSKAFLDLKKYEYGHLYVLHLLGCRQGHIVKATRTWEQSNNGEIYFTYAYAKEVYGVKYPGQHNRTLKQIHNVGIIDIAHQGGSMDGDRTLFSISHRWKKYGTPEFELKEWPKDYRRKGNPNIKDFGKGR